MNAAYVRNLVVLLPPSDQNSRLKKNQFALTECFLFTCGGIFTFSGLFDEVYTLSQYKGSTFICVVGRGGQMAEFRAMMFPMKTFPGGAFGLSNQVIVAGDIS